MITLAACGGGGVGTSAPLPTLDGKTIEIPSDGVSSVGYITQPVDTLVGVKAIRMRYVVKLANGAHIVAASDPSAPSRLTLYFQRQGDTGTAVGQYEAFRWYAPFASHSPILPGEYVIQAPMDGPWSAVLTSTRENNPQAFDDAIREASKVGFVLGGGTGLGHGIKADGQASITVLEFELLR